MIADQQKHGDAGSRKPPDPLCELTLVRLRRIPRFIRIAREKHHVNLIVQRKVDEFVECVQEVSQPRRESCLRVGPAVVLDADVQVSEVDDFHASQGRLQRPKIELKVISTGACGRYRGVIARADCADQFLDANPLL